ncbi:MAG: hypothetical protein EA361_12865 [Bacteroidetes bacterium]|nr:MAG: hypothetical protein EA361_12865 [Bacteroidota bacterium]
MIMISCSKNDESLYNTPISGKGSFTDHGFIPAILSAGPDVAEFQSIIYYDDYVFVATSDGIWKNHLPTREWSRSGLDGKVITAIYNHPEIAGRFFAGVGSDLSPLFKTLYISNDGGMRWVPATRPVYDNHNHRYEAYVCFAARPGHPDHVYANLENGKTIAISTDGGYNWTRMNDMDYSYFGYQSNIAFLHENQNTIYQGSETPMDFAWLGRYEIDNDNPVVLDKFTTIIDIETWSNRRPKKLMTYQHTPGSLYVGQEGALSKVTGSTNKFIFKRNVGEFPYTYMYGIWVNPNKTDHILFGGGLNDNEQPMQLFETSDEGTTIHRFTDKMGLENPVVMDIIQAKNYPAILLNDKGADRVKLVLYKPYYIDK